jgi:TonB family protein
MKVCPQCRAQFDDDINFCLNDGSPLTLSSQREVPTENYPASIVDNASAEPQPTVGFTPSTTAVDENVTAVRPHNADRPATPRKKSKTVLLVVVGAALFGLFVIVFGVAGIGYYLYRQPDVARANSNSTVISNLNSAGSNSNLPAANTTSLSPNSNSSFPSNSAPISNTPANRKVMPTPAKTGDLPVTLPPQEPPPPMTKSAPKTISGGVLNGKAISLPKPAYPPAARAVRASGSVQVQVLIDETGRVISASPAGGHPLLQQAAAAAAREARFSPTMLNGQPVKVSGIIVYNFVL